MHVSSLHQAPSTTPKIDYSKYINPRNSKEEQEYMTSVLSRNAHLNFSDSEVQIDYIKDVLSLIVLLHTKECEIEKDLEDFILEASLQGYGGINDRLIADEIEEFLFNVYKHKQFAILGIEKITRDQLKLAIYLSKKNFRGNCRFTDDKPKLGDFLVDFALQIIMEKVETNLMDLTFFSNEENLKIEEIAIQRAAQGLKNKGWNFTHLLAYFSKVIHEKEVRAEKEEEALGQPRREFPADRTGCFSITNVKIERLISIFKRFQADLNLSKTEKMHNEKSYQAFSEEEMKEYKKICKSQNQSTSIAHAHHRYITYEGRKINLFDCVRTEKPGHYRSTLAYSRKNIQELGKDFLEGLYNKSMECNESDLLPNLGELFWWLFHLQPWVDKNIEIAEMIIRSIYLARKGEEMPSWKEEVYLEGEMFEVFFDWNKVPPELQEEAKKKCIIEAFKAKFPTFLI